MANYFVGKLTTLDESSSPNSEYASVFESEKEDTFLDTFLDNLIGLRRIENSRD